MIRVDYSKSDYPKSEDLQSAGSLQYYSLNNPFHQKKRCSKIQDQTYQNEELLETSSTRSQSFKTCCQSAISSFSSSLSSLFPCFSSHSYSSLNKSSDLSPSSHIASGNVFDLPFFVSIIITFFPNDPHKLAMLECTNKNFFNEIKKYWKNIKPIPPPFSLPKISIISNKKKLRSIAYENKYNNILNTLCHSIFIQFMNTPSFQRREKADELLEQNFLIFKKFPEHRKCLSSMFLKIIEADSITFKMIFPAYQEGDLIAGD